MIKTELTSDLVSVYFCLALLFSPSFVLYAGDGAAATDSNTS